MFIPNRTLGFLSGTLFSGPQYVKEALFYVYDKNFEIKNKLEIVIIYTMHPRNAVLLLKATCNDN